MKRNRKQYMYECFDRAKEACARRSKINYARTISITAKRKDFFVVATMTNDTAALHSRRNSHYYRKCLLSKMFTTSRIFLYELNCTLGD